VLADLAAALTLPGMPAWTGLVLLAVLVLVALAYLLMPFSVFGVKGRLDAIEAQLDDLQTEMRTLALRLGEPTGRGRRPPVEMEDWAEPVSPPRRPVQDDALRAQPPVPPPAAWPERGRNEPRVEWPRQPR
jgi:hypothetical protein